VFLFFYPPPFFAACFSVLRFPPSRPRFSFFSLKANHVGSVFFLFGCSAWAFVCVFFPTLTSLNKGLTCPPWVPETVGNGHPPPALSIVCSIGLLVPSQHPLPRFALGKNTPLVISQEKLPLLSFCFSRLARKEVVSGHVTIW